MAQQVVDSGKDLDYLGAVEVANHLLERFGVVKRIKRIEECNDDYFIALYEAMTGEPLEGVDRYVKTAEGRARNCDLVIEVLSKDVLETDLSHIDGRDIVEGQVTAIGNLLEIFIGLLEYIFEEIQQEEANNDDDAEQQEEQDSDILSEDHDILSNVIQEEFGKSYQKQEQRGNARNIEPKRNSAMEPPTRDTDVDSQSSLDFTQDSLYNTDGKRTVIKKPGFHVNSQMPPFAYFSSSGSNSTEDLAREAEMHERNAYVSSKREGRYSSAARLQEEPSTSGNKEMDASSKTDPTQVTDRAKQKYTKQASVHTSVSTSNWPSTLSANELNISDTRKSNFESSGKRPQAPFATDLDNCSEKSGGSSSSVVHKHTHHHYYHKNTSKDPTGMSLSQKADQRVAAASNASHASDSMRHSKHSEFLLDNLTATKNMATTESGRTRKERDISTSTLLSGTNNRSVRLSGDDHRENRRSQIDKSLQAAAKKQQKAGNIDTSGVNADSIRNLDTAATRVRSVQTSVSDLPAPERASAEQASSSHASQDSANIPQKLDTNRSVQSSVSELNDLLNKREDQRGANNRTRYDILQDLEQRLEEVRESVRNIDASQEVDPDATDGNIKALRSFLQKDDKRVRSSYQKDDHSTKRKTESVCSDSEFDYGTSYQAVGRGVAEGTCRSKTRQTKFDDTSDTSDNEKDVTLVAFPRRKKKVQFVDLEKESRDERLERLVRLLKSEDKENSNAIKKVKGQYGKNLREAKRRDAEKNREKSSTKTFAFKEEKSKKTPLLQTTPNKSASRLARIYGARSRKPDRCTSKPRKRSASCSPVPRARRKGRMVIDEEDILPVMEDEFPHLYLSPVTAKMMWQKQMHQLSNLANAARPGKPSKIQKQIEDANLKQEALMDIMKKELAHNKRLRDEKEKARQQMQVKTKLRDRRLASARARRYYNEYQVRTRARMLKRRTKEEKIFKHLFEDALEIQKDRVKELRAYAKEQREIDAKKKQNDVESMENFYRDQFSMMAESVARERFELQVRQQAQNKVVENMRNGMRKRMETDIKTLQNELAQDEDSTYFRQLDAETLKKEFQLATYKIRM